MKKFSASKKHEDFFCLDSLMAHLKGNAVNFPTVYCWSNNSKRLRNGGGVPSRFPLHPSLATLRMA